MGWSHFFGYFGGWSQVRPQPFHHFAITQTKSIQSSSTIVNLQIFWGKISSITIYLQWAGIRKRGKTMTLLTNVMDTLIKSWWWWWWTQKTFTQHSWSNLHLAKNLVPITMKCRNCKSDSLLHLLLFHVQEKKRKT